VGLLLRDGNGKGREKRNEGKLRIGKGGKGREKEVRRRAFPANKISFSRSCKAHWIRIIVS